MLETLLMLLRLDLPCPEIMLEEDGCLNLYWLFDDECRVDVSIWPNGKVSWACDEPRRHGTDIEELKALLIESAARSGLSTVRIS
jgi:hypothetical protein